MDIRKIINNIKNVCRLCLSANKNIHYLFNNDYNLDTNNDLIQSVNDLINIEVTENDGPNGICEECIDKIKLFSEFRKRCHAINEYLQINYIENHLCKSEHNNIVLVALESEVTSEEKSKCYQSTSENNNVLIEASIKNYSNKFKNTKKLMKRKPLNKNCGNHSPKLKKRDYIETKTYRGLCHMCGKEFQHLWVHLQSHSIKPTETCSICGKAFRSKANLRLHILTHKEANLPCTVCGKKYYTRTRLKRHMRVHTGKRPFVCNFCGKSFYTKYNVDVHMRTHTGEKPFTCIDCQECFTHSYALKNHLVKHHKDDG